LSQKTVESTIEKAKQGDLLCTSKGATDWNATILTAMNEQNRGKEAAMTTPSISARTMTRYRKQIAPETPHTQLKVDTTKIELDSMPYKTSILK
jgi:hypothetical protein